tara:strand:+ start:11816 stop:18988 length:7173 start_codon:yes stop_codon:yes gene_type:complete
MPLYQLPDGKTINLPANMSDEEKAAVRNQLAKEYPSHFTPQYDRTIGGHALEFAKGIPRGFLSSLVSAGEGAVNLFDVGNDSALSEGLRGIQQNIQDSALGPDEAYQDAYSSMLGQGLGSFATFMTPGAIARGVGLAGKTAAQIPSLRGISNVRGLGTTLSTGRARSIEELGALSLAVPMGISEQGQRLEQARLRGEEVGAGKEFIAELAGAGIGMSELLPIERAWRRFGKANMGRFDLGEATKAALMQAGVEGAQEAGAGIMQNLTAKNLYDPELAITDSALDEASVGGGVGFISSFLMSAFGARRFAKNRLDEVDRREQLNEADSKPIASTPEDLNPTTSTALVPIDQYDTLDNLIKKQQAIATENEINEAKDKLAFELATNNPYFEVVETQEGYDVVNTRNNEVQSSTTDINEAFVTKQQLNESSNKLRADQATQELLRINGLVGSGAAESMARNILNPETSQIPKQVLANYDSRITDEMVKEARIVLGEIKGRGGKPPARTIDPTSPRAGGALQVWRKNLKRRKIQEKDFYTPAEAKKLLLAKDFNSLVEDIANTSDRQYEKYRVAADDTSAVEERLPPLVDGQRSWSVPEKITEKTFKDLAKDKNIRLDINSKSFQNFLETYTGERSFSKLSKAQKKMAYAKFSRIPSFAKGTVGNEVPPVPLPNFAPRPYTFEQYDAVYKNSLERPNQVVSPKSIMDLTGLDRESATEMFEDFVESGRLAPQERIIQQMGYFTPQGRMFNRRGAPYKEAEMTFTKKQTYKGKWIPRDVAELESEYVYDLTATKGESVEDYAQRLTNMGVAPEVINDLVESETTRQAEIEANKNRIISPAGKDITEKVLEEKEIKQKLEERIERFEKELKKAAKSLNIPDRVTVKLVKEINKQRDQGTWEATKRDYRDPSGRILISVGEAMVDGDGNPLTEEQTIINLARTLHHEGIHAFRDLDLFTDREFNILKKFTERVMVPESVSQEAFNNNLSFNDLAKRTYPDLDADSQNEEAVAMLFEYWSQDKSIATGKPRNIFERIANFIRSIVYSTNVAGFRSPIDILQDVESGVIGARKVGEVRSLRELDRLAAKGVDVLATQTDEELDVEATLTEATARASRRIDDAPLVVAETKSGEARGFIPDDVNVSKDAWSELQDRTFDTILTPEGSVKFLENIGIDHTLQEGFGSFGNDINKNFNITLPESSYEEAQAVASVMGHALMQDSVVTGFLQPSGTNRTLVLSKQDNSNFNIDEINQINELLKPLSREAVWGEENIDFTAMDNAIFIGDPASWTLDFDSYTPEQLQSFRRIMRPLADTMGLNLNSVNLNTELVENENEGYREKATRLGDKAFAEGSSSIQEAAIRDLYEPSWKAYQNFVQEIGSNYEVASPLEQDGNILDTIRASRRIKDTPTLTEQQQQELYDKAENNVKSTSRGAIPLWNLNADPYATAVGYKYAEKYNVEGFGEGKTIEEVIDESMDDPIVTRASRRVDTAKWESEYEILKNVSYGKEKPKPSVSNNQDLTAFQSVLKNIFPNTNIDQQFERFRQKFIYQYQAIARGEKEAQEATGVKYEADASATSWMAFSDRARGLMAEMLVKGGIVLKQTTNGAQAVVVDNADMKTMNGEKIEGGLIGALARLHSYGRQANIPIEEYAKSYSIVQRGIRLKSEGIATPVTDEMIKKADQMVKQYPIIKEFYDNYQTFNNSLVQFAIDTGILDEKLGQEWKEQSDYYPFYRHFEEDERYDGPSTGGRMLGKSPFDVEIEGSGAPVNVDMLEAITRNSMALLNRAMRNQALKFVARDAVNAGNAVQLKEKPNKIGKDVIWYQDGGQGAEVWFRVNDPMLLESLIGYGVSPYRGIENTLAIPSGFLRDMITRSPDFVIVNMMRDTLSAYVTSGAEMTPVIDTGKNFFTSSGNDVFEKLKEMAVVGGYDFSNDPKDVAKYIKQQVDKLEEGLTVRSGFRTVWDALGQMTTKSDAATRIAVYQDVYKKVYNRKVAEGVSEQEAEIVAETEAAYQALEVINFSRRGNSPFFKVYTAAVPFLNARIQGLDVLYRSASGQYASDRLTLTPAEIQQNMLLRLGSLGMITALYYAMVSDTEEYKNARREVRDDNWIIPIADDFAIKIPIPFEVGVIAKVFPERLMDGLMGESTAKDVIESMNRQLATSLAFPALPIGGQFEPSMGIQAIAPLVDAIMNHDSYTKKAIVPYYMEEGLEAGYQSQYSTNEMARLVGEFFNISPIKVQYVMQGYGGSMGSYALSAVDAITRSVTDRDFIPPSADRMPVMRRFVQTSRGGGLQQQFYELRGEVNEVVQTLNRLKKEGRTDEYISYRESHADILNTKKAVLSIDRYMKNWRTKRDKVVMSKTLSPTVKAQLIKQLENERDRRLAVVPVIKDRANIPFADFNL